MKYLKENERKEFYLNYEECKVIFGNNQREMKSSFILTMRNVKLEIR